MTDISNRQKFSYGTIYRWMFLWMPYAVILSILVVLLWTITGDFPLVIPIAITVWLIISILILIMARPVFKSIPVKIEIDGEIITLCRWSRCSEINVNDLVGVNIDVISPWQLFFGGWIRFSYKQNGNIHQFYVGPYLNGYFDLIRYIDTRISDCCPCNHNVFSWSSILKYIMLAYVVFVLILCVIAIITLNIIALLLAIFLIICLIWFILTYPSRVYLTDHSIKFYRLIGQPREVFWSHIVSIDIGLPGFPSSGGFTLFTQEGSRLWFPPLFAHQFELMICTMRKLDR